MAGLCIGQWIQRSWKFSLSLSLASLLGLAGSPAHAQPPAKAADKGADKADEPAEKKEDVEASEKTAKELFDKLTPDSKKGEYADIGKAIRRFQDRKIDDARKALADAKKKNPKLPPVSMLLVRLLIATNQQQMAQAARAELEKCVLDNPADPDAFLFMADIAVQQQEITAADMLLHEAERLITGFKENDDRLKDFQVRVNAAMAAVNEAREQWPQAQARLTAWLAADPKSAPGQQRLAGVLVQLGKFDDAQKAMVEAAKYDDTMINPAAAVGMLCQQAAGRLTEDKDKDKAKSLKDEAAARMGKAFVALRTEKPVAADPKDNDDDARKKKNANERNLRCLLAIADFYLVTGDSENLKRAVFVSDAALAYDPKSVEAKIQRGIVARFQKEPAAAEKYLAEAQQMSPSAFMATNHLAIVLVEQDSNKEKQQRALEFAAVNARQYPKSPEAAATLGWVLFKLGDKFNAGKALEAAASGGSLSADSAYYAAVILADNGRQQDAVRLLEATGKTTIPFFHKEAAKDLQAKLEKELKK